MKKSVYTFVLLASSLVMLGVMPFLNNNNSIVNPAMAQEYDKYVDSSYSQYPTDDKKYECRTGPFEGFFVSSVEFCKHVKFEDKRDHRDNNQTGTQGPTGPQGPPGATGATGPQGPPGIVNAELCPPGTAFENFYVLNGTTAESCDIVPPQEPNATLAVTKTVTCTPLDTSPQTAAACETFLSSTPPSSFNITVTGNNPNPSEFAGSNDPVVVTLNPGIYEVIEEPPEEVTPAGFTLFVITSFSGDCTDGSPDEPLSTGAFGTIEAGESQICDITNAYRAQLQPQP